MYRVCRELISLIYLSSKQGTGLPAKTCRGGVVVFTVQSSRNIMVEVEDNIVEIKFAKLTAKAHPPSKGSEKAAGYDLRSAYNYIIPARSKELVKTDLQIQLPDGCYGRIAPRSGLACKYYIDVGAGVIDQDYRGNVAVVLFNHGAENFEINEGDRIAQLICERIFYPKLKEVDSLDITDRGSRGFGSTGVN